MAIPEYKNDSSREVASLPQVIYNPITAMGYLTMFMFQLDNTKR